jgi:hypothetical protein
MFGMIKSAIKLTILTIGLVFLLAVDVGGKPIFTHIYQFISPATKQAQKSTSGILEKSISATKDFGKMLFDNSEPRVKDSVKSSLSSRGKKQVSEPLEKITDEEKSQLDSLIKNH